MDMITNPLSLIIVLLARSNLGPNENNPSAGLALKIVHLLDLGDEQDVVRVAALRLLADVKRCQIVQNGTNDCCVLDTGNEVIAIVGYKLGLVEGLYVVQGDEVAVFDGTADAR
ncbi:hypothetical protein PG999_001858 [Apiospora kogelbergensis]|uniref:Uncharacterized protein n=1 Tax=Apiospora kogelbergensis TaxID=1337665 RepID=A0AAW0R6R7_9PEZI